MAEEITGLPGAVASVVNKLVENEGASFPFLVAAVGLNGAPSVASRDSAGPVHAPSGTGRAR